MANLNLPFLLMQPSTCHFTPSLKTTKLIAFDRYNNPRGGSGQILTTPRQSIVGQNMHSHARPINHTSASSHGSHMRNGAASLHSQQQQAQTTTKFEFGKYSTFDDTPKSLLVTGDAENGTMVLWHQDTHLSTKLRADVRLRNGGLVKKVIRNLVSLIPRVALVPSISQETGPLIASCLLRSPAPNILSTSTFLMATIHRDGILRLWTTDDGRCILASSPDLLPHANDYCIKALSDSTSSQYHIGALSGVVAITWTNSTEVLFVNTYRMTIVRRIAHGIPESRFVSVKIDDKRIILEDTAKGAITVWKREGGPAQEELTISVKSSFLNQSTPSSNANRQSVDSATHHHLVLDVANTEDSQIALMLNYKQEYAMGKADSDGKIVTKKLTSDGKLLVVFSNGVSLCSSTEKKLLIIPKKSLTFAKFMQNDYLVAVDTECNLIVYDVKKILAGHQADVLLYKGNIIEDATLFEAFSVKTEGSLTMHGNLLTDLAEEKAKKVVTLRQQLSKQPIFKFNKDLKSLYTVQLSQQGESLLVQWNLETLFENILTDSMEGSKLPLTLTPMRVFSQSPSQTIEVLNFQPLLIKSFYNRHQFSFFYSDEKVTESLLYTSANQPCQILGTNYGRLFMVPLFQESDEKVQPILVVDAHQGQPIRQLFIAYNSGRKAKKGNILQENGGHLISVCEGGTISVTNMNSGEIVKALNGNPSSGKGNERQEYTRAEGYFRGRESQKEKKRRNSFANDFSVQRYFHLVKVRPQKVFPSACFGPVDKLIEVKNIHKIREHLSKRTPAQAEDLRKSHAANQSQVNHTITHEEPNPLYAVVSSESGTVHLLSITNLTCDLTQYSGITGKSIQGIYRDIQQSQIYIISSQKPKKLLFFVFNSRSNLLLRKLDLKQALDILMIRETVDYLLTKHAGFKQRGNSIFDYESFQQFFQKSEGGLMGLGSHKILDYLSLAINLPLEYHPHTPFSTKYTKTMRDLVAFRKHLAVVQASQSQKVPAEELEESQREVIRGLNEAYFMNNRVYRSDFNEEMFEKQAGVTCLKAANIFGERQDLMIANGKQILKIFQEKYKVPVTQRQTNTSQNPGKRSASPTSNGRLREGADENAEFELREDAHIPHAQPIKTFQQEQQYQHLPLAHCKWPTRLLSLLHPFNVEVNLDDALEKFAGLNLPFLDFRVGLQGADESFSFVMTREDEDFHAERNNPTKIIRLLRLSAFKKSLITRLPKQQQQVNVSHRMMQIEQNQELVIGQANTMAEINEQIDQLLDSEPSVRFFGSEHWKISNYLSTMVPSFFLTMLTAVVDYMKEDVTYMIREWLFIATRINQQRTLTESSRISLSAASKILLKKDPCISSAGRDVLLKPVLFALVGTDRLQDVIDEWTAVVLDTYKKLKKESTVRNVYGGGGAGAQQSTVQDKRLVNQYFGELEIRGLICISYYALYNHDQLDAQLQYRVSKLTTILTREIVDKYNNDRRYIHLLTHLLQLLSTWMKMHNSQYNSKAMIGEVIRLLLFIYNFNKSPLNRDAVITKYTSENFYLIKPTQPEFYLKLTAAKALLEIGENYTHDFLMMVQEEATHLNQGGEYQQNVLEILKIFINSSCTSAQEQHTGVSLEHHLIQITQILLKCFDPNELALRKNSHKIVSLILSIMVKMFPMVAFHHESQRLAVGTHDGPIAIYDMRTSAKWKILEGHTGNITCITFDSKGNLLASYSAVDKSLQLWKVGNTGFFSTIMGGTSKSSNKINLNPLQGVKNPHSRRMDSASVQQQEFNKNDSIFEHPSSQSNLGGAGAMQATQSQNSGSKKVNCCSIKFMAPKEKEVELVRENGKVERHRLVK